MWPEKGVSQVRSIAIFGPCIDSSMACFSCLDMLRVLDLQGCSFKNCGGSNKLCIGNLIHLRYLGLNDTGFKELPGGIEKLQFLQVLKMRQYGELMKLPESIFGLRRLMCVESVGCCPRSGNLLRNLTSLQVLNKLYVDKDPAGTVEALGHLTRLTELIIGFESEMVDQSICDAFIDSLGNLPRLQRLLMEGNMTSLRLMSWEHWAPPPRLQWLDGIFSRTLSKWISPASLPHLAHLYIMVQTVGPEDIQILGTLPNLVWLSLEADYENNLEQPLQKSIVSADAFPCLRYCYLLYVAAVPSMFTRGAMPRVQEFHFHLRARDFFNPSGLDFDDLAIDHLPLLRHVDCVIETDVIGEEEVTKLRGALQNAADVHPNHPKLFCY